MLITLHKRVLDETLPKFIKRKHPKKGKEKKNNKQKPKSKQVSKQPK
jgi:hypothetical protein